MVCSFENPVDSRPKDVRKRNPFGGISELHRNTGLSSNPMMAMKAAANTKKIDTNCPASTRAAGKGFTGSSEAPRMSLILRCRSGDSSGVGARSSRLVDFFVQFRIG